MPEFINLKLVGMIFKYYSLKFSQLVYTLIIMVNSRARMSKFFSGVSEDIVRKCRMSKFIMEMEIS